MPRTAAELDVEVEALKARVGKLEADLLAEQQSHQRTRADLERWGNRAWQVALACLAAIITAALTAAVTISLYLMGVRKP